MNSIFDKLKIIDKTVIITGGAGLLGMKQAEAVIEGGGIPILLDLSMQQLQKTKEELENKYQEAKIEIFVADITNKLILEQVKDNVLEKYGSIYGLINNAANNPKMEGAKSDNMKSIQFIDFPVEVWNADVAVGLTGAFLCAQVFGREMEKMKNGSIINISSDYGLISPDQRIYRKEGLQDEEQVIKPVTYSVIKHGIIGLTKYLATYWALKGIRVNTLCPASLYNSQDECFVEKISQLIPLGRMSNPDEYPATVLYMLSEASSYMTGATVVLDGGRTIW